MNEGPINNDDRAWLVIRASQPMRTGQILLNHGDQRLLRAPLDGLDLSDVSERDYRLFTNNGASGMLFENAFNATLLLRLVLRADKQIQSDLDDFLDNNPFQSLKDVGVRQNDGNDVIWLADVRLNSAAFLSVAHEMITFAMRSNPHIMSKVRAEVFDENGCGRLIGGLTGGRPLTKRWFTYRHPTSNEIIEENLDC